MHSIRHIYSDMKINFHMDWLKWTSFLGTKQVSFISCQNSTSLRCLYKDVEKWYRTAGMRSANHPRNPPSKNHLMGKKWGECGVVWYKSNLTSYKLWLKTEVNQITSEPYWLSFKDVQQLQLVLLLLVQKYFSQILSRALLPITLRSTLWDQFWN